jgi:hypothetical protein
MEYSKYQHMVANDPEIDPYHAEFFSDANVRYISESITKQLRAFFPHRRPINVTDQNIRDIMLEYYRVEFKHPRLLTQQVLDFIVGSLKTEVETEELSHTYNPWIQHMPENYGISATDPAQSKLNNRKYDRGHFVVRY